MVIEHIIREKMHEKFVQLSFFLMFLVINGVLYGLSVEKPEDAGLPEISPVFWNASDGQRYWGVAVNLAENGKYISRSWGSNSVVSSSKADWRNRTVQEESLARAGPLPALMFSVPIKVLGFDRAGPAIVIIQCALLFATGFIARYLAEPFGWSKNILQGLIIFNPNLIVVSHHAQSEALFLFLFTGVLVFSSKYLTMTRPATVLETISFGVCLGALPLARPLGAYVVFALPILLCMTSYMTKQSRATKLRFLDWKKIGLVIVIVGFVTSPWLYRNYQVFGSVSLTQSEGIMMEWHYDVLKKYLGPSQLVADPLTFYSDSTQLKSLGCDNKRIIGSDCKRLATLAYLKAIVDVPPAIVGYALLTGWTKLFFSGGSTQLARYLGVSNPNLTNSIHTGENWWEAIKNVVTNLGINYPVFFVIFFAASGFAFVTRMLGLLGFIGLKSPIELSLIVFYMLVLSIFLSMYLFVGISRFRVPLEPILMLLSAGGISTIPWIVRTVRTKWAR